MDSQVGTKDAVPVLHGRAGSSRLIPSCQQGEHRRLPCWWKRSRQLLGLRSQDGPMEPSPADQMASWLPKQQSRLLLHGIECWAKARQAREGSLHMTQEPLYLFLDGLWGLFT